MKNGAKLETAQQIANHESPLKTKLYDRRQDDIMATPKSMTIKLRRFGISIHLPIDSTSNNAISRLHDKSFAECAAKE